MNSSFSSIDRCNDGCNLYYGVSTSQYLNLAVAISDVVMIRDRTEPKIKQIRVSNATYEQLVRLGTLEDTFDSVIKKLLVGADNGLVASLSSKSRC